MILPWLLEPNAVSKVIFRNEKLKYSKFILRSCDFTVAEKAVSILITCSLLHRHVNTSIYFRSSGLWRDVRQHEVFKPKVASLGLHSHQMHASTEEFLIIKKSHTPKPLYKSSASARWAISRASKLTGHFLKLKFLLKKQQQHKITIENNLLKEEKSHAKD